MNKSYSASLLLAIAPVAQAEQAKPVFSLDTIVVTASRSEQTLKNVPASISIIDHQQLEQSSLNQLANLLPRDSSLNSVQSGGIGQQQSVFLRGSNSNHTLMLKDGVRLNSPTTGIASAAFFDLSNLERVEILKGPASVQYGSDAIGGVIQLISKPPLEDNSLSATVEYGSQNTRKGSVAATASHEDLYAEINAQSLKSDGWAVADNDNLPDSGYQQSGFNAKVGVIKDSYQADISFGQNSGESEYDQYGQPVAQHFMQQLFNASAMAQLTADLKLNARLAQFNDDLKQLDSASRIDAKNQTAESSLSWQINQQHKLLTGVQYQKQQAKIFNDAAGFRVDQGTASTGYFAQHQFDNEKFNTQVGLRLEDHETFGNEMVGQIAGRYHINDDRSVHVNFGRAFRAPSINELYAIAWGGNPDLKAETSQSYEIGLSQRLHPNLGLQFNLYHSNVDDLINWNNGKNVNIGEAKLQGVETALNWQSSDWHAALSYHYLRARNEDSSTNLQRRPRQNLNLNLGWSNDHFGIDSYLIAKGKSLDFDGEIPGYATMDIAAYWQINPKIKAYTQLQNIFNAEYKTASYGGGNYYIHPGMNASVGLKFDY